MLKYLLWLNRNLIKFINILNKRIEKQIEYKKIKKIIRDRWGCIDLLKYKDGIIIVIRENEQSLKVVEWIQKNILTEPDKNLDNYNITKDTPNQEEQVESANDESKQSYRISNIKLAYQNTDGINILNPHMTQKTTENTSNVITVKPINDQEGKAIGNQNYKCSTDLALRYPFRKK